MKHRRERIAVGVYLDRGGKAATVKVKNFPQKEKRFPLDTELAVIKQWQDETRGELLLTCGTPAPRVRGGFTRSVALFLRQVKGRPCYGSYRSHLKAWADRFRNKARQAIRADDVRLAIAAWRTAGIKRGGGRARPIAPKTLLHRYTVLQALYRTLDGPKARTPCDDVPRPTVPKSVPQDVELATIRRVVKKLKRTDPQTHARLWLLAATGKRPVEVMRTNVRLDLNLKRRIWTIRPAKGGEPQQVYLTADMVSAWRAVIAAKAEGLYDTSIYAQRLRAAGWPKGVRPYNVRHALAIDLLRRGADLSDVQAHLGHASIETTRKFYAGILTSRQKLTSRRLAGRMGVR